MDSDLTFRRYGLGEDLQDFLTQWAVITDCPIVTWCKYREGTVGDHIDDFLRLAKRDPQVVQVAHYHISHILDSEMRRLFIDVILTSPMASADMWLTDTTIDDETADRLLDVINHPKTGVPDYADKIKSGVLVAPLRNQPYNLTSEIAKECLIYGQ